MRFRWAASAGGPLPRKLRYNKLFKELLRIQVCFDQEEKMFVKKQNKMK